LFGCSESRIVSTQTNRRAIDSYVDAFSPREVRSVAISGAGPGTALSASLPFSRGGRGSTPGRVEGLSFGGFAGDAGGGAGGGGFGVAVWGAAA